MPVSVDASKTLISGVAVSTWANRPTTVDSSQLYLFTDIGASGTLMRYAGGRWRPLAGQAQLASLGAAVTGIANSETIVLQTLIPAGAWQQYDRVRIFVSGTKSGTNDTFQIWVRIGTAGTTADTAITGLSNYIFMTAVNVAGGGIYDIKLQSNTSAQKMGSSTNGVMTYYTNQPGAGSAATAITDASANELYISISAASSGASNTVSVLDGQIQLLTP